MVYNIDYSQQSDSGALKCNGDGGDRWRRKGMLFCICDCCNVCMVPADFALTPFPESTNGSYLFQNKNDPHGFSVAQAFSLHGKNTLAISM